MANIQSIQENVTAVTEAMDEGWNLVAPVLEVEEQEMVRLGLRYYRRRLEAEIADMQEDGHDSDRNPEWVNSQEWLDRCKELEKRILPLFGE